MRISKTLNIVGLWCGVFLLTAVAAHAEDSKELPSTPTSQTRNWSLSAKAALQRALQESHAIKGSSSQVDAASAQVRQQQSKFLPQLNAELAAGTVRGYEPIDLSDPLSYLVREDRNQYNGKLVLTQNLFSGFANLNSLAAAQASKNVAQLKLDQQKNAIIEESFSLYFGIQLSREQIAVEKEIQTLRENQLRRSKARWRAGKATKLDYLQADYALRAQNPKIQKLQVELQNKKIEFTRLLGIQLDETLTLTDSLTTAYLSTNKISLPKLAEAYEKLVEFNRDIRIAQAEVKRVDLEASQNGSRHLPTLDLVLTAEIDSRLRENISSEENRRYSAMLRLNVPIFSGLDSFSTLQERKATRHAYSEQAILTREQTLTKLSQFYAEWELNKAIVEAETANFDLSQEAIKNAQTLYDVGRATITEVLDSYSRKLDARKNLLQGMYDQVILAIKIRHLLGGEFEGHGQ